MLQTFTSKEVSKLIGMNERLLPLMHEVGMLHYIAMSSGRRYTQMEIARFLKEYLGEDISSAEKIRSVAAIHKIKNG